MKVRGRSSGSFGVQVVVQPVENIGAKQAKLPAVEEERASRAELERKLSELEDENTALLKMMGSQQA